MTGTLGVAAVDTSKIKKVIVDVDCFLYPIGFAAAASGMSCQAAIDKLSLALTDVIKTTEASAPYKLPMTSSGPVKYRDRFRNTIPYKENRKDSRTKPLYIEEMQNFLLDYWGSAAYLCDPEQGEADDFVCMEAWDHIHSSLTSGWPEVLIVGVDKDLKQIPGLHYNPNTGTYHTVGPNEADLVFNLQVLTGDAADRIPGIPGVGPAKATRLLEKYLRHTSSYAEATLEAYLDSDLKAKMTSTEIADYYFETCNLLYLRRSLTDVWEFGK